MAINNPVIADADIIQDTAVAIQEKDHGGKMEFPDIPSRIRALPTGDEVLFSNFGRQYTRTVEIPDGVTALGSNAFSSCTGLTEIDLKNVTTFLSNYHFRDCSSLRKVMGKKVTSTNSSFYNCIALKTAILSNVSTIGENTFFNARALKNVDCRNVGRIVNLAFSKCNRLNLIDLTSRTTPTTLNNANVFNDTNNTWIAVVANDMIKSDFQNATNWSTFASHFRTIAEVEAEVGMTYDEYYYQLFGEPRNEVAA